MKALVMAAYGQLTYMDVPLPVCGAQDVLVQVKACAVCGGDVHGIDGRTGRRVPPIIMGHEASGIIAAVGAQVPAWQPGDRVTFDSMLYCGECPRCRSGETNLCTRLGVLGVTHDGITRNGAFADYVSVPGHILHRLPDSVSFIEAAMVEPLTVAYHAATRFPAPQDGVAAVVGVGTIGLLLVQVLKSLGVRTVVAVDIAADRLQTALANGADAAVDAAAVDARAQVLALAGSGAGLDAVYDATGIETTVNFCLSLLRTGGRCTLIGNLSPEIKVPLQQIVTRQLSLYGSYASAGAYPTCLQLIATRQVNVQPLISAVVPLSEGHAWIRRLYEREPGLAKIVLVPDAAMPVT